MTNNLLTVKEAAAELRVHPETLRRWCRTGRVLHRRIGPYRSEIRLTRSDLDEMLYDPLAIRTRSASGLCRASK